MEKRTPIARKEHQIKQSSAAGDQPTGSSAWIPNRPSPADNPHTTDDFARVYELTGNRITAPIAMEAFRRVGPGSHVLDIAAGAGALSIRAAFSGASVLAVDIAPGMVNAPIGASDAYYRAIDPFFRTSSRTYAGALNPAPNLFPDRRARRTEQRSPPERGYDARCPAGLGRLRDD
jgi:hypothetical protein